MVHYAGSTCIFCDRAGGDERGCFWACPCPDSTRHGTPSEVEWHRVSGAREGTDRYYLGEARMREYFAPPPPGIERYASWQLTVKRALVPVKVRFASAQLRLMREWRFRVAGKTWPEEMTKNHKGPKKSEGV